MAAPLRTLSARILLGFAVLIVTFGITSVLIVNYMDDVGVEIAVIRTGYLKLALITKDLARRQEDLRSYVSDDLAADDSARKVAVRLKSLRSARDKAMTEAQDVMTQLADVPERHRRNFEHTALQLGTIRDGIGKSDVDYTTLLVEPPLDRLVAQPADAARVAALAALTNLKNTERTLANDTKDLASRQEKIVTSTASNLEYNETRLRLYTIVLGVIAVVLGLLITVWVTLTLRPLARLRDGARRIAAGDTGNRIDERGPTEVAELAREFNVMARAVEERQREVVRSERLAAIGKMAAMITHEVRNPLSSIALNTELLGDELGASSAEARALCKAITHEVDRLTAITEDYLTFARLPKPTLSVQPIGDVVRATCDFLREELAGRRVTLTTTLDANLPAVPVDGGQLRQCVLNLVRNAAEALDGRTDGTITVTTRAADGGVELAVADNGPGIAAEALPRLFDPFFTTKETGTGLGLAVCQQIARDHGGELRVDSVVGAGTTLRLLLPASVRSGTRVIAEDVSPRSGVANAAKAG